MIKNFRFTLPKLFIISLSLQLVGLSLMVGSVLVSGFWMGSNCFDAIYSNDVVFIAWAFWAAFGLFNLSLMVMYALRIARGKIRIRSKTNVVIALLILANMACFLPKEPLLDALGCYFG